MSDNPRPQLYGARYTALLANRADEEPADEPFTVAGKHCESGDVLIDRVALPEPRRGDLLAVPATGAYTLAMSSNYNGVPRPAAVLVARGDARLILRRETIDDLLAREPSLARATVAAAASGDASRRRAPGVSRAPAPPSQSGRLARERRNSSATGSSRAGSATARTSASGSERRTVSSSVSSGVSPRGR